MTPSTLVRARGPFTFIAAAAAALERKGDGGVAATRPRCVAFEDDGRRCGLPARYVDFKQGGHVCFEHRPDRKKELLTL